MVARQAGISPEPRVVHQRPTLIQELMWLPRSLATAEADGDTVRKVIFTFYNDQLARIVVAVADSGQRLVPFPLVKATPDQFTEIARFRAIEGETRNHPLLVGDALLVRHGQEMAALTLRRLRATSRCIQ